MTKEVTDCGELYQINEDGEKVIPPSMRKDGTMRKEIRVRQGYVPQDEKGCFQSRASEFKKRREASINTPPGSRQRIPGSTGIQENPVAGKSKNTKKSAKSPASGTMKSAPSTTTDSKKQKDKLSPVPVCRYPAIAGAVVSKKTDERTDLVAAPAAEDSEETKRMRAELKDARKSLRNINILLKKTSRGEDITEEETKEIEKKEFMTSEICRLKALVDAETVVE